MDTMESTPSSASVAPTFAESASLLLARFQGELRRLVDRMAGIRTPTDLQRTLGISYNLSWRVIRSIGAQHALEAGPSVPAHVSVLKLISAAQHHGVPIDGDALEAASQALHTFISQNAGDRATFDTMVAALTGSDAERIDLDLKRSAFRINRQLYGRSVDVALSCWAIRPSIARQGPRLHLDALGLRSIVGLRRLRAGAPLYLAGSRMRDSASDQTAHSRPLDERAMERFGVPLITGFSDDPPPQLIRRIRDDEFTEFYLTTPDVGLKSSVSCALGEIYEAVPADEAVPGEASFRLLTEIGTPCVVAFDDVLVHESIADRIPEHVVLVKAKSPDCTVQPEPGSPALLPVQERVTDHGEPPQALHATGVPRYRELVEHAFDRAGWDDLGRYRLFRCEVQYPVLNSELWMEVPLRKPG